MTTSANLRPILCVTRDEHGAVASTIATIYSACFRLRLQPHYIQHGAYGYANSRTKLFEAARRFYRTNRVRGFLLDDDVRLEDQKALERVIQRCDQRKWNVVAPYRSKGGRFSIVRTIDPLPTGTTTEMLSEDDLAKIAPWSEIELAGLGFYYGDIPLDYVFREGNPYVGEDLNFFHDNTQLATRLAPLYLEHLKQVPLPGVKYEGENK